MNSRRRVLLAADGIVNLFLGLVLLLYPAGLDRVLGLPHPSGYFYTALLGAVLIGIGFALFIEWRSAPINGPGLGMAGAIAINLCGGVALLGWLVAVPLDIPLRGHIALWLVVLAVLGIGVAELLAKPWRDNERRGRAP